MTHQSAVFAKARRLHQIMARDRFLAALHEAAHATVARHYSVGGMAQLVAADVQDERKEKTYVGYFTFDGSQVTSEILRLISVAGAAGELLFHIEIREFDMFERLPFIHEGMSPTDCQNGGFPEYWDDIFFAEGSDEFAAAVEVAERLLSGELRTAWLGMARNLRLNKFAVTRA